MIKTKQNIELQFDMHHGYKILEKAIECLDEKDRKLFEKFVKKKQNSIHMHIYFKKILLINGLKIYLHGFLNVKKF